MAASPAEPVPESDHRPGDPAANRAMMDHIAAPFAATRHAPWAQVSAFLAALPPRSRVLDLAGGNGRHAVAAAHLGLRPVLLDVSGRLVRLGRSTAEAAGLRLQGLEADAGRLPFQEGVFDAAVFVAGVHCIRGRAARVAALAELRRVLRARAPALVTVWAAGQDRFRDHIAHQAEAAAAGRLAAGEEVGDVLVPWAKDMDAPVARFFHVYGQKGLQGELVDAGFVVERIEPVTLTRSSRPDNLFAYVRAP